LCLGQLKRIKTACSSSDDNLLALVMEVLAVDQFTSRTRTKLKDGFPTTYIGFSGTVMAEAVEYRAARAQAGLGVVRIPAGRQTRVRSTAAEALVSVWGEMLGVVSNAGVLRAIHSAVTVLAQDPYAIPPWLGLCPDRFSLITRAALSQDATGMAADIARDATRLFRDEGWKNALWRIDRRGLAEGLAAALALDLDALEAELQLEQAAAARLALPSEIPKAGEASKKVKRPQNVKRPHIPDKYKAAVKLWPSFEAQRKQAGRRPTIGKFRDWLKARPKPILLDDHFSKWWNDTYRRQLRRRG
jgi:hypothetical protein